jgi:hypothetical protein
MLRKFMVESPECAVRVTRATANMPDWAKTAIAARREVHRFLPPGEHTRRRLWRVASRLNNVLKVAVWPPELTREMPKLLDDLPRLNLARLETSLQSIIDQTQHVCRREDYQMIRREPEVIEAIDGRTWERVNSLAMLDRTGSALNNCLREAHEFHEEYWAAFCKQESDFWALFSSEGVPIGVIQVKGADVQQARGVNNCLLHEYSDDLEILISRLGLNPESSADLMELGLFQLTWTRQRQPDWTGDYFGTALVVWVRPQDAILGIGSPNPRYVTLDFALAYELTTIPGGSLGWACRGLDGAGWTTDDLLGFLTRHLARVAPKVAKRLFSIYVLAAAEGLSTMPSAEDSEDV